MGFRNRYGQIAIAVLIGLIVFALPRPQGALFDVANDPERRLGEGRALIGSSGDI